MARPSKPGGGATGAGVKPDRGAQGGGSRTRPRCGPETRRLPRPLLASGRGAACRLDPLRTSAPSERQKAVGGPDRRFEAAGAARLPAPALPAFGAVSIFSEAGLPLPPGRRCETVCSTRRGRSTTAVAEMAFHRVLFYASRCDAVAEGFSNYTGFCRCHRHRSPPSTSSAGPIPPSLNSADHAAGRVLREAARAVGATGIARSRSAARAPARACPG